MSGVKNYELAPKGYYERPLKERVEELQDYQEEHCERFTLSQVVRVLEWCEGHFGKEAFDTVFRSEHID